MSSLKPNRKRKNTLLNLAELGDKKSKTKKFNKKIVSIGNDNEDHILGDEPEADCSKDDPFVLHLNSELSPQLSSILAKKPPKVIKEIINWPTLGKLIYIKPDVDGSVDSKTLFLNKEQTYASVRQFPEEPKNLSLDDLFIKKQILNNIKNQLKKENADNLSPTQKELLTIFSNYHNVYYPELNQSNCEQIRFAYCIHAINHAMKTRLKIVHHNTKLQNREEVPNEFRDQGLVRPKVLILVPFRSIAHKIVQHFINIMLGDDGNILNKKRFLDEYTGDTILMPDKNPRPIDYQQLFSGNTDDNFKLGLSLTRKCLKLFTDFYASDIIIASPLGLRVLIGTEDDPERHYDFLASIEILIMDQAEVFTMQNWEHVLHVMEHMHLQPQKSHDVDITRIRSWALKGCTSDYMQCLIFSANSLHELSALFNLKMKNYNGKVSIVNPKKLGSISQVIIKAPQLFHYVSTSSVTDAVNDRFQAFVSNILPRFKEANLKHVMIYIPSYFDFVRLRNYFKKQELHYVQICEYTEEKKITRARSKFFHGETQFLLYTERFHFFRRFHLRGIQNLVFYQPPSFPLFYSEISNFLQDLKKGGFKDPALKLSIDVLYTKYDILQIANIVGSERAKRMLASEKPVHMFSTES